MPEYSGKYSGKTISDYQHLARLSSIYITELFGSKQYPLPSPLSLWQNDLPLYIASALAQAQLEQLVLFGALVLLQRYKMRLPQHVSYGRSAYRLFISSYMVATKLMYDRQRPMTTWRAIAQNTFSAQELTSMELEFCRALDWNLMIGQKHLAFLQIICDVTEPVGQYSQGEFSRVHFSNSKHTPLQYSFVPWGSGTGVPIPTEHCDASTPSVRTSQAFWKRINLRRRITTLLA